MDTANPGQVEFLKGPSSLMSGPRVDRQIPGTASQVAPGRGQHGAGDFLFHQEKAHLALTRRFH